MGDIIKLTVVLTIVSVTAALAIAFTNSKTKDRILEQQQISEKTALQQIMPPNSDISVVNSTCDSCPPQYWIAQKDSQKVYAFKVASRGYAADIQYFVSVTAEGKIMGMKILEQSETPGLGSRVQESISKKYIWNGFFGKKEEGLNWFTKQFEGIDIKKVITINKTAGEWHKLGGEQRNNLLTSNEITAITGSTISTRAVTRGLENQARSYLNAIQGN